MKKFLLFTAILFGTIAATRAQITLNSSDMAQPGDVILEGYQAWDGPAPASGANQTWNFPGGDTTFIDTTVYYAASETPFADSMSNANLATGREGFYTYYNLNQSGFYLRGLVFPFGGDVLPIDVPFEVVPFRFNPQIPLLTFPATMGMNAIGTGTARFEFPFDTVITIGIFPVQVTRAAIVATVNDTSLINGFGNGVFASATLPVLRNEQRMKISFRIQVRTALGWVNLPAALLPPGGLPELSTTSLLFWANNRKGPVAALELDSAGSVLGASIRKDLLITGTALRESRNPVFSFDVLPNPVQGSTIRLETVTELDRVELFSSTGKKIKALQKSASGKEWNLGETAPGFYAIRAWDREGKSVSKRLVVR